ncbi:unnamed protein product, partial [Laminaria digitata]
RAGVQVDNPCAVLDQENAKKFLQGDESDKYAFFMKATDLARVSEVSKMVAFTQCDMCAKAGRCKEEPSR